MFGYSSSTKQLNQTFQHIFCCKFSAYLEKKHGVNPETDQAETYLLKGPQLRNEESNMVSIKVTANPDGSASVQLTVSR